MKKVARFFGKEVLREVDEKEFYAKIAELRKETGDRAVLRAIHFFNENRRVQLQVRALKTTISMPSCTTSTSPAWRRGRFCRT